MPRMRLVKSNFTAGEIAPGLLGRGDLRAYENGAALLRNVIIQPLGGVQRRPGLRLIDVVPGPGRLISFDFNTEQTYLLVLTDRMVTVYRDNAKMTTFAAPWTQAQLGQIFWTQSADTLLIVHPDVAPRRITRRGHTDWTIEPWRYVTEESGKVNEPYHRFAPAEVTLEASATSGTIQLTANVPLFLPGHEGTRFRLQGRTVRIDRVITDTVADATVVEYLAETQPTIDWEEAAFSLARGWPVTVTFHQHRLVVGGSRDLPNHMWFSKSADLWNFDIGSGLDDEAIAFSILSDHVNAIRAVFSGRDLQVMTTGAEWTISGAPITPAAVDARRQTRIGMPPDRTVLPVDVDGATLFAARNGREVREFVYTDLEQAYQAPDLALLARHFVEEPVDMTFDDNRRVLVVVMGNGTVGLLTVYRAERIVGWSRLETDGTVLGARTVGTAVVLMVDRDGDVVVEILDPSAKLDAALDGASVTPADTWTGLDHLAGRNVMVVADGEIHRDIPVREGTITLPTPVREIQVGLPYRHEIEPLPPSALATDGTGRALRVVEVLFRVEDTSFLAVDDGRGLRAVPLRRLTGNGLLDADPPIVTGDIRVGALGWYRLGAAPPWRIEQDVPQPFTLLSTTMELKVND